MLKKLFAPAAAWKISWLSNLLINKNELIRNRKFKKKCNLIPEWFSLNAGHNLGLNMFLFGSSQLKLVEHGAIFIFREPLSFAYYQKETVQRDG